MVPIAIAPLVAVIVGALGAAAAARFLAKEWRRVNAELHPEDRRAEDRVDEKGSSPAAVETLRRDPETGVYRVDRPKGD